MWSPPGPTQFSGALERGTPVAEQALVPEAQPSRLAPEDRAPHAAPQGVPRNSALEKGGGGRQAQALGEGEGRAWWESQAGPTTWGFPSAFASGVASHPREGFREHLGPSLTHWPWTGGLLRPIASARHPPGSWGHCPLPSGAPWLGWGWPRASVSVQELGGSGVAGYIFSLFLFSYHVIWELRFIFIRW